MPFQTILLLFLITIRALMSQSFAYAQDKKLEKIPDSLFGEIAFIQKKKKLVIALCKEEIDCFHSRNALGKLEGIDIDIAQLLGKTLTVPIHFMHTKNYDRVIDAVASGKADLGVSMLSFSPERSLRVLYSPAPYIILNKSAMVNRIHLAKAGAVSLNDLIYPSKALLKILGFFPYIGVQKNTSDVSYVKNRFPNARYKTYTTRKELYKNVADGKISIVFTDNRGLEDALKTDFNLNIKTMPLILTDKDPIHMIFSPYLPHFAQWASLLIKSNPSTNLTYGALKKKYKPEPLKID